MPFVEDLQHPPTVVITLTEAKRQLRVDDPKAPYFEDESFKQYIKSAIRYAENFTKLEIVQKKFRVTGSSFEDVLSVDKQVLISVDAFTYKNPSGDTVEVPTDQYFLQSEDSLQTSIQFKESYELPELLEDPKAVTLELTVGFPQDQVPEDIRIALLMKIASFDSHREDSAKTMTTAIENYLNPYKTYSRW